MRQIIIFHPWKVLTNYCIRGWLIPTITQPTRVDMKAPNISKIHEPLEHGRIVLNKNLVRSKIIRKRTTKSTCWGFWWFLCCGDSNLQNWTAASCLHHTSWNVPVAPQGFHGFIIIAGPGGLVEQRAPGVLVLNEWRVDAHGPNKRNCLQREHGAGMCWPCCELFWSLSLFPHTSAVMLIVHSFIQLMNHSIRFDSIQFTSFKDSLATAQRRLFQGSVQCRSAPHPQHSTRQRLLAHQLDLFQRIFWLPFLPPTCWKSRHDTIMVADAGNPIAPLLRFLIYHVYHYAMFIQFLRMDLSLSESTVHSTIEVAPDLNDV